MTVGKHILSSIVAVAGLGAAAAPAAGADVVINEVNCEGSDWVELVNRADQPAEVSGWLLTDEPLIDNDPGHRMLFAAPTLIGAGGDLVVERGAGGFPFGISCDDTIRLADAAETLRDETTIGERNADADTWGRYPSATGAFVPTLATPGAPNQPSTAGDPNQDQAAWLFDPEAVVEIELTVPQESLDALAVDPGEYQDAAFSLETTGGAYGPLDVGLRLKGGLGSFRPLHGKAAFKLKFNHSVPGQRFLGLRGLTLNNMVQDRSMLHEALAHEAFRAAGVAAPRTGYAFVRLNSQDYGVYLNIENVDELMLSRWFETTQHLYEGELGDDAVAGGAPGFEVDEGSDSDRGDLETLIAVANAEARGLPQQIDEVLDLEQATRMWAVEHYAGHWDGYAPAPVNQLKPNNYYLHSDASGRFAVLPWGADQTWVAHLPFDRPAGILFERCLEDDRCEALYEQAVREVRGIVAGLPLDARASAIAVVLAPWQQIDPRREYSLEQIEAAVVATRSYLASRPGEADAWLASRRPRTHAIVTPPETTITKRPRKATRARRVRFAFSSESAAASFECKLNAAGFAPCASPLRIRVGVGRHRLRVRAVSPTGLVEPTPAEARFRVRPG